MLTKCVHKEEKRKRGQIANKPRHEKTNVLVSDLVRHRPGCTATKDGWRLEISELESRGLVLAM